MTVQAAVAAVCGACGTPLALADRFCSACGHAVEGAGPARDPLIGALVGERYRILNRIGTGGMGAVYAVEHVRLGKIAALKLLHAELSRDESMVRRFTREARAVSRLHSPYTVSVFDSGRSNGLVFLVMELLRGHDLGAEIDHAGPLSLARVVHIVRMVAASLAEAHAQGIVHRDIKPQNIFLCEGAPGESERIKVLDFGLAKLTAAREESLAATHAGTVLGTPYYMAPEQIHEGAIDHRCDIYSTAALAWCLLTGAPPFRHATALGVLHMHLSSPIPRLREIDASLGPLDDVFARGLAKRPEERYGHIEAFSDALTEAARRVQRDGEAKRPVPPQGSRSAAAAGETSARWTSRELSGLERADLVGTREEFDRYERSLRAMRIGRTLAAATAIAGAAAATVWLVRREEYRAVEDAEPNDNLALATPVAASGVVVGSLRRDSAQLAPDRDVFVVEAGSDDRVVSASLTGLPGVDVVLELADGTGRYLARADASGMGGAEVIVAAGTPDRRAFLVVRSDGDDGAADNHGTEYQLRIRVRDRYAGEEREPNDAPGAAMPTLVGQSVVGLIGFPGDRDVFALPPMNGEVAVALSGMVGVDLTLAQIDADGSVLNVSDAHGPGGPERLRVKGSAATPVWVRVEALSDSASYLAYAVEFAVVEPPTPM